VGWIKVRPTCGSDHPHLKRDARGLGIADGRVVAGIGKRHDKISFDPALPGQDLAHLLAALIDIDPEDIAVWPGKVDMLEDAEASALRRPGKERAQPLTVDDQHFAGLNIPHICGLHQIERAGLRGYDIAVL
jgi:hypothetical protein